MIPLSKNRRDDKKISREIKYHSRCKGKGASNIVRFKEDFGHENKHCIVMEYMAGGDL